MNMRILKIDNCPTLSGKSSLTYHLGVTAKSDIHIRVFANTGGGYFSQEWIAWKAIQTALKKLPADKSLTSMALIPLFKGKSANTPGFLLAVLRNEGLVEGDAKPFLDRIDALVASDVELEVEEPVKKKAVKALSHG